MSAAAAAAAPASECSVAHDESSPSELLSKTEETGLVVRDRAVDVVVVVEEASRQVFFAAGLSLPSEARFLESGAADGDMVALASRVARARLFTGDAIGSRNKCCKEKTRAQRLGRASEPKRKKN